MPTNQYTTELESLSEHERRELVGFSYSDRPPAQNDPKGPCETGGLADLTVGTHLPVWACEIAEKISGAEFSIAILGSDVTVEHLTAAVAEVEHASTSEPCRNAAGGA
jgi:hypothetical protein